MILDRVTITGADDSIDPSDLLGISRRHPFVEWGILVSRSHSFEPRWPSPRWIQALQTCARPPDRMSLSLHVCGAWVRDLLMGDNQMPPYLLDGFARVQLNFHGEALARERRLFPAALAAFGKRQIIFQVDGAYGLDRLREIWHGDPEGDIDAVPLFDVSHGSGATPVAWPSPVAPGIYHGYAGGLGPQNIVEELARISAVAGRTRVWIDMEMNVRSHRDRIFDLHKVGDVLTACSKVFVSGLHAH